MVTITYKFRVYPSGEQQNKLFKQFNICKEIYNELLNQNKEYLIINKYDFNSIIKDIKTTCPSYYSQVYSQVLQDISDRVNKALQNFFRRIKERKKGKKIKTGYPRFKSRIKSITYPQSGFKIINKKLYLSKIGNIPIISHRNIKGKIKTLTMKINRAEQWFACFSCEMEDKIKINNNKTIGIDVGLENFATLSSGETINNPRYLIQSENKLKKIQRRLSRKKIKSKNRIKSKFKVAKQHIQIANQRNDFLHKLSRNLIMNYGVIAVEDLNIKGMVYNKYLAKHIHDASWSKFIQMLSYKAVMSGGQLIKSLRTRGSSKRCSSCGSEMKMELGKRMFECGNCGLKIHRDYNAAINHLNDTAGLAGISTPARDHVRLSIKKAEVDEAGTKRDELLMRQ